MECCGIIEKDREKGNDSVDGFNEGCSAYPISPSMRDVVEVLEKEVSFMTPLYPFHHQNPLGYSMVPLLQGTPEVCPPEVPVNDKSLAISSPTAVVVPGMFINADREKENKEELLLFTSDYYD
ncbi:hypothetical protein FRX31_008223 [Thalictrum thalictroides]|uniref:Uncharacterized protein n=1 Tax=Thalictrum thalictroides TaxID=46969 RepID=A0A7J6X0D2_THATH|nr:hypothetical protein FRX31_008223 [Thalictrum thalictroides]